MEKKGGFLSRAQIEMGNVDADHEVLCCDFFGQ